MAAMSCPSADRLWQLLSGILSEQEQAELIGHLDACTACQQTLEHLAGVNAEILTAVSAHSRSSWLDEAPLRRVLHELETDPELTQPDRAHYRAAWVRSLLRPGQTMQALGMLEGYEVTEQLGQGGMGVVLKAFEPGLNRWVAIKVLAPDLASEQVARRRFAREAQAAAAVRHTHVVTIHAVRETKGLPFLVMEYVAGGSLQDYLDHNGSPAWQETVRLGAEIAAGLAAAHARGLVHRDIKPSNILLQTEFATTDLGVAKISDFGLARAGDEARLTRTGIIPGTPMYMAPEQALSAALDARADLFSLGSVLYTLCTGNEPFQADSPMAVLRQVCEATPRPIPELNSTIPPWLVAIIDRLHAKEPGDRFDSATEVADLLAYNLAHPNQPRLVAPARRPRSRRSRKRWLLAGVFALLLAGITLSEAAHLTHWFRWNGSAETASSVPLLFPLRGHDGPVMAVAFAPDGRIIATGSDDTTLRLWSAATGNPLGELPKHGSAVLAVAFTHSGKLLLSGGADGTVHIWDTVSGSEQQGLARRNGNVRRIAIAPNDRLVAVGGSNQGVELWNLETRQLLHALAAHHGSIMSLAFAPDGATLATGDANGQIRLWDPARGSEVAAFQGDPLGLRALAFSPDSQVLASAGTGDKDVKIWNMSDRHLLTVLGGYENGVQNEAFAPTGRLLATGSRDGTVKLWNVDTGQALATWQAHQGSVLAVTFSPDGNSLATVGEDHLGKLWDVRGLRPK